MKPIKFKLTTLPTPLHPLKRLSVYLGGPEIWVKRDDLTDMAMGGNKTRKLEYLVADALSKGCDTLVTAGAIQSNHCRQTAAAANRAGLSCHLVLNGNPEAAPQGNLLLDTLFGPTIHWVTRDERESRVNKLGEELKETGLKPYIIPVGGSNGMGAIGYVDAMLEVMKQAYAIGTNFDLIIVASSSGGTQAGLQLGAILSGFSGTIMGISIDSGKIDGPIYREKMARIAAESAAILGEPIRLEPENFKLNCDYLGQGYSVMGELERNAIHLAAEQEALLVGPVYTGRALGGLIDLIRSGVIGKNERILFWHTGDTPALFAYSSEL